MLFGCNDGQRSAKSGHTPVLNERLLVDQRPTERLLGLPRKAGPGGVRLMRRHGKGFGVGSANTCVFTARCNVCVWLGCRRAWNKYWLFTSLFCMTIH